MKLGRNDPCSCGSGKKYKKCCLEGVKPQARRPLGLGPDPASVARANDMFRQQQAEENVRRRQQGHGRAIISWADERNGYRFVAVGSTVHYDRNWVVFHNFLQYFLKTTMSNEWGARERDKGQHPLFRWLAKTEKHSGHKPGDRKVRQIAMMGFIACWLNLSYALYLIAHHDTIPKQLLRRLRNHLTFLPAYHEATVGAALAVAGMEITCVETKRGSDPVPEFKATSKASGKTYDVEAKRKEAWRSPTDDPTNPDFLRELEVYVRDQIYNGSKKKLTNPVYWFELSIPTIKTEADWRAVAKKVEASIYDAEKTMSVNGDPIAPAYVVITNNTFLAAEDMAGNPHFAILQTIKMDDFPFGRSMETEAALEGYDKHRDMFWLMEAWKTSCTVPTTFDGSPPELLDSDGRPQPMIKVGDMIQAADVGGKMILAKVEDMVSMGNKKAMAIVVANDQRWMINVPLTDAEAQAAENFTDAVFGKTNVGTGLREDDPFDLYDFFLDSLANMTQANADKFFDENRSVAHYKGLPLKEARVRIAREYTKWSWARSQTDKATKAAKTTELKTGNTGSV